MQQVSARGVLYKFVIDIFTYIRMSLSTNQTCYSTGYMQQKCIKHSREGQWSIAPGEAPPTAPPLTSDTRSHGYKTITINSTANNRDYIGDESQPW